MRAHTASGIGPVLALAPEPTAARFGGNRVCGSAPARGTGASLVLGGVVAWVGDWVLVLDDVAVPGSGVGGVLLALEVVDIGVGVERVPVVLVLALLTAGEPAPQPARVSVRARQVRALAAVVALTVALRRIVRSVRWPPGAVRVCHGGQSSFSACGFFGLVLWSAKVG